MTPADTSPSPTRRFVGDGENPQVNILARALEWVRDPDEPRRTVIPTGYTTLLSSEIPGIRDKQAELLLRYLGEHGWVLVERNR